MNSVFYQVVFSVVFAPLRKKMEKRKLEYYAAEFYAKHFKTDIEK